ncbi:hypothetical protein N1851_014240 [Merluccius polli]|uniref:Reverse transcriptase n=1 Tax=Merluccius polli TaxID=89951 RepID=A0AA47MUT9_MERPO|nr:hypothetical protein N1851_014240 [Merluccius polli]
MNSVVKTLLKARNSAFYSGNSALYSTARSDLRRGIKAAKVEYRRRVESYLEDNNPRRVWQGIQHLTNYKGKTSAANNADASLVEELNHFFARFEAPRPATSTSPVPCQPYSPAPLTLHDHQVRRALKSINPRKAAGPDGVLGNVLRACADQLAGVLTGIFNSSLCLAVVPSCLKAATIIPVPKKTAIKDLNDYRPVACPPDQHHGYLPCTAGFFGS